MGIYRRTYTQNALALIDATGANPDGRWVATPLLNGSSALHSAPGYHSSGVLQVFALDGQALTLAGEMKLGAVPEGVAWSPDSQWLYVGNYNDKTLQVFHIEEGRWLPEQCRCQASPPACAV